MKININTRSEKELIAVLEHLGHTSPSHTIQTLITQAYKTLMSIPTTVEESPNDEHSTSRQ